MRPLLAAWVVIGFSSCGHDFAPVFEHPAGTVALVPPELTPRERLELDTAEFRVHPVDSLGTFSTRRVLAGVTSTVPIALVDGWLEGYAFTEPGTETSGPRLGVTRFDAALADVTFTAQQLPPNGLTLSRVSFALAEPAVLNLRWFGDGTLGWAKGALTVNVHTALRLSTGGESRLEVARLTVPVELTVSQTTNGLLGLWVHVASDRTLWNWAGLFELGDLSLSLEAFEVRGIDRLPPGVELN